MAASDICCDSESDLQNPAYLNACLFTGPPPPGERIKVTYIVDPHRTRECLWKAEVCFSTIRGCEYLSQSDFDEDLSIVLSRALASLRMAFGYS